MNSSATITTNLDQKSLVNLDQVYHLIINNRRHSEPTMELKNTNNGKNSSQKTDSSADQLITELLQRNPDFLDDYVMRHVDVDQLERWLIRKTQRIRDRNSTLSRWKFCVHADKRKMLEDLTKSLYRDPKKSNVLNELASTVACAVNASGFSLLMKDPHSQELKPMNDINDCNEQQQHHHNQKDYPHRKSNGTQMMTTLANFVAEHKSAVSAEIGVKDNRFPGGVPLAPPNTAHVLAFPLVRADNELTGVIELYRLKNSLPFHEEDEEITNSYLVWGGIALHYAELYTNLSHHKNLNTFLLTIVKSIFQDIFNMDKVIGKILSFARRLVNADRTSLFMVDGRSKELYAHMFEGSENSGDDPTNKKEIRFPIGTGIAGYVAATGECLNIADAYQDYRFNRNVDLQTGYRTKSILCMPIFSRNKVIGVVQMVNKKTGTFTKDDEEAFTTFATYCGLALDHARLYDKIRRSHQKNKVALEIISYHNSCTDFEIESVKEASLDGLSDVTSFDFSPYQLSSDQRVLSTIRVFESMAGIPKIDDDDLYRFTLTVRKNYRRVPYHNWTHGFSVAHTIYLFIKDAKRFRPLDKLALFVAGLCHDLDHRGTTNEFLINSSAPLAAVYSTSPLEHHHFKQTVSILQHTGNNILKNLSSEEYKTVLATIKHCILATDLALFFPNSAKLKPILESNSFDWNNAEHRSLLVAIAMTAADLNSTAKPWQEAVEQVQVLCEEFYAQGDIEKLQGLKPIPMRDRDQQDQQAALQVGFLKNISIPCFEMVAKLLDGAGPFLDTCKRNLENWKTLVEQQDREKKNVINNKDNKENLEMKTDTNGLQVKPVTMNRLNRTRSLYAKRSKKPMI